MDGTPNSWMGARAAKDRRRADVKVALLAELKGLLPKDCVASAQLPSHSGAMSIVVTLRCPFHADSSEARDLREIVASVGKRCDVDGDFCIVARIVGTEAA